MIIKRIPTGMLSSNCYIVGENGEGVIIDPGADSGEILEAVEKLELGIKYIILTHAHIDHICSMDKIRDRMGAQVAVHEQDAAALANPRYNAAILLGLDNTFREADLLLHHGDIIEAGGLKLEIIHTPGHTPGCICIKTGNVVFTGDTLFRMGVGRTDFVGGDSAALQDSIKNRLMKLDRETTVYPGHGTSTTIGYEKESNPFI